MRQGLWDRRLGGRGERRSPFTRFGSGAATRTLHAPAQVEQTDAPRSAARSMQRNRKSTRRSRSLASSSSRFGRCFRFESSRKREPVSTVSSSPRSSARSRASITSPGRR